MRKGNEKEINLSLATGFDSCLLLSNLRCRESATTTTKMIARRPPKRAIVAGTPIAYSSPGSPFTIFPPRLTQLPNAFNHFICYVLDPASSSSSASCLTQKYILFTLHLWPPCRRGLSPIGLSESDMDSAPRAFVAVAVAFASRKRGCCLLSVCRRLLRMSSNEYSLSLPLSLCLSPSPFWP